MQEIETPRPALAAKSLPARYYIDPEYYRIELERFFCSMWVHVGRSAEIGNPGDFLVHDVAGESMIVVRRDDGGISAYYNVCPHRGTRLTDKASGRFGATIQCPYHAWTFDLNGCLSGAPQMDRAIGFRREDYPLHDAALDLWAGHIFLNMARDPVPLVQQLGGLPERFRCWGMENLRPAARVVYDVAANWKLIVHNYSECLHCPGVHPALQKLTHYLSGENEPADAGFLGGRMRLRDGVDTMSFDGRLHKACLPGLPADDCRYVYFYAALPNLLLSLHPDYVVTHTLWPRGVDRTEIVCEWLFHPDAISEPGFSPDDAVAFWDLTNRQDWHVCEQMQLGLKSRAYRPGPYSHREELLHGFDQLIVEHERAGKNESAMTGPANRDRTEPPGESLNRRTQ
jgi:Rieske 2Fe-2S family protein